MPPTFFSRLAGHVRLAAGLAGAVKDGRIVENWHLEDNLTLLKQLGAIKP